MPPTVFHVIVLIYYPILHVYPVVHQVSTSKMKESVSPVLFLAVNAYHKPNASLVLWGICLGQRASTNVRVATMLIPSTQYAIHVRMGVLPAYRQLSVSAAPTQQTYMVIPVILSVRSILIHHQASVSTVCYPAEAV